MAFADTQKLIVQLDLKGNLKSGLAGATKQVQAFDKATSNTQKSLGKFGHNISRGVLLGAGAIAAGAAIVVHAAGDYEDAFAGVRKTVTATEPELQALSDSFREMSKVIPISAADLARLGEAGGALGVPTENLKEFVRVTALLGETTNVTADEAATSLGVLGNVLHLTSDDYSRFASSLVALGNAGASTEADILAIAERAGAAGALIGVSTTEVLGLSSAVASLGIESEAGGTALQKFFIDSSKAILGGTKDLKVFAKVAGKTTKQFQKNFKQDAGAALEDFLAGLGKLSQTQQLQVLEQLGFTDARITRTLLGLANNTKLVADQQQIANTAFKENTALTKEAEQRNKTFNSQLAITKNVLTDIAITIGSKLLPKLVPLLQEFNAFVSGHQADISKFGDDLAAGLTKVVDAVGKVDWQPFIDGLKLSASLAKGAFDVFNALPEQFKALILVGAGVNKVTGGLITSIGKDIASALGGQFLSRGSSPANPLFVSAVGGLGGGTPGGGTSTVGALGAAAAGAGVLLTVEQLAKGVQEGVAASLTNGNPVAVEIGGSLPSGLNLSGPLDRISRALSGDFRSELEVIQDLERQQATANAQAVTDAGARAARDNVTNERLEAIRGYTATQAANAHLNVAATERAEAIATAKANEIKAQLAAGDTRTEMALIRTGGAITAKASADSQSERSAIGRAEAASRTAGQVAATAIRNKDLSVTVINKTSISIREQGKATLRYQLTHQVAS